MMIERYGVQIFSILLALLLIIVECGRIRQNRENIFWVIPLLIWAFMVFVFYAVLFFDRLDGVTNFASYGDISAILRMIGLIAVITTESGRWLFHRRNIEARQPHGK